MSKELIQSFDGKLFLHRWAHIVSGTHVSISQDHYTVIKGEVYIIESGKLTKTGDDPLELCSSMMLGDLDKDNLPERIKPSFFTFEELEKTGLLDKGVS